MCLLGVHYGASLPARQRAAKVRARRQTEPVRILFYHRVADDHPNAWTMSTRRFERQISWLRARFDLVSLEVAQSRIAVGRNDVPTACITFDDGYADNMHFAVPLLLQHDIPFTYFVSTNHVLRGEAFPHDIAIGRPLAPNTAADLKKLAESGVDIGGHTRDHVDLGSISSQQQLVDEIAGCKRELEELIERPVRYFAFPYGQHANMSSAAFRAAYEAGYDGVCSAYGGYNFPGDNPFHLRRFHADPESFRFKNWMTVDPRKLRTQRDFDPGDFATAALAASQDGETRHGDKESLGAAPASPCLPISVPPCLDPS
ncbi:MAG TPA: polysaccharide deacetylase family protein, partial [Lacipirellulaceae bacterium]|nr:polysaccharide deacetylase family protein [Lacipirellulaceae bacterium]